MRKVQLYIDPECRLSKVPYKVPNNAHYVTFDEYELLRLQLTDRVERLARTGDAMAFALSHNPNLTNLYAAEVKNWLQAKRNEAP